MMMIMMEIADTGETTVSMQTDDGAEPTTMDFMSADEALSYVSEQVSPMESDEAMWDEEAAARAAQDEMMMMEDMV
jgi:hypothetical protein